MVRIAYFGTDGCPGHHVIPIRGKFTEEDVKVIESVDCDDFYKVFDVMRFKIAEFKGWTILGIPARKAMVKAGNNATKILVKTFRGKLFKKAFERARRGKDISSFERQEKESGFNFLHNPNNGRMQSGHIIIDGIGLFKQIIHER